MGLCFLSDFFAPLPQKRHFGRCACSAVTRINGIFNCLETEFFILPIVIISQKSPNVNTDKLSPSPMLRISKVKTCSFWGSFEGKT